VCIPVKAKRWVFNESGRVVGRKKMMEGRAGAGGKVSPGYLRRRELAHAGSKSAEGGGEKSRDERCQDWRCSRMLVQDGGGVRRKNTRRNVMGGGRQEKAVFEPARRKGPSFLVRIDMGTMRAVEENGNQRKERGIKRKKTSDNFLPGRGGFPASMNRGLRW